MKISRNAQGMRISAKVFSVAAIMLLGGALPNDLHGAIIASYDYDYRQSLKRELKLLPSKQARREHLQKRASAIKSSPELKDSQKARQLLAVAFEACFSQELEVHIKNDRELFRQVAEMNVDDHARCDALRMAAQLSNTIGDFEAEALAYDKLLDRLKNSTDPMLTSTKRDFLFADASSKGATAHRKQKNFAKAEELLANFVAADIESDYAGMASTVYRKIAREKARQGENEEANEAFNRSVALRGWQELTPVQQLKIELDRVSQMSADNEQEKMAHFKMLWETPKYQDIPQIFLAGNSLNHWYARALEKLNEAEENTEEFDAQMISHLESFVSRLESSGLQKGSSQTGLSYKSMHEFSLYLLALSYKRMKDEENLARVLSSYRNSYPRGVFSNTLAKILPGTKGSFSSSRVSIVRFVMLLAYVFLPLAIFVFSRRKT